jgi:hypothetical protein
VISILAAFIQYEGQKAGQMMIGLGDKIEMLTIEAKQGQPRTI